MEQINGSSQTGGQVWVGFCGVKMGQPRARKC